MRTKALILSAIIGVAGIASSFAQNVYSVNVVGYINLNLTTTFSLIGNQLDDGAGNFVTNVMAGVPNGTIVYKFNGVSYNLLTWRGAPFNQWTPATLAQTMTMSPGEGVFVKKPATVSEINITCVGEVMQGELSQDVVTGFEIYSAMVPQEGGIQTVHEYVPANGDIVYKFNGSTYALSTYRGAPFNRWTPAEPVITVGEAFFIKAAAAQTWTRTFNVE